MKNNKIIATVLMGGFLLTVVTAEAAELYEGKPANEHTHSHYDFQQTRDSNLVVNAGTGDFRIQRVGNSL